MENIKDDIREIKATVDKIFIILNGNGTDGLVTKVALNKSSIYRVWWWLGGVSFGILGIAAYIIKSHI